MNLSKTILAFNISAILGINIHLSLTGYKTFILANQFLGFWFALNLGIVSGVLLWIKSLNETNPSCTRFDYFYFGFVGVCNFICFICYIISNQGGTTAAYIWALLTVILSGSGLYILRPMASCEKPTRKCSNIICLIIQILNLLWTIFLTCGAIVLAFSATFKAPGKIYSISTTDGRIIEMHIFCIGPEPSVGNPPVWIIADAAHGVVDFYGLQYYLSQKGLRVCTQDNPGFGWTSDLISDIDDYAISFYDSMFDSLYPELSVILVGWAEGGAQALRYYRYNASRVKTIALIQQFPGDIEFEYEAIAKGFNEEQKQIFRREQMMSRLSLCRLILGLAIPWGLLPLFIPLGSVVPGFYPVDKAVEYRAQLWSSKAWVSQYWGIAPYVDYPKEDIMTVMKNKVNITIGNIVCNLNETQICKNVMSLSDCSSRQSQHKYYYERQLNATLGLSPNATIVWNMDSDCSLDIPIRKPLWTANSVWKMINISLK